MPESDLEKWLNALKERAQAQQAQQAQQAAREEPPREEPQTRPRTGDDVQAEYDRRKRELAERQRQRDDERQARVEANRQEMMRRAAGSGRRDFALEDAQAAVAEKRAAELAAQVEEVSREELLAERKRAAAERMRARQAEADRDSRQVAETAAADHAGSAAVPSGRKTMPPKSGQSAGITETQSLSDLVASLRHDPARVREAIVLAEILGPPKAFQ